MLIRLGFADREEREQLQPSYSSLLIFLGLPPQLAQEGLDFDEVLAIGSIAVPDRV